MALSRGDEGERGAVYICLCNGLTDCRIQQAVAAGAGRPKEVYASCGCKAQCGGCTRTILALIRDGARTGAAQAVSAAVGS
jgi:bacterioferritin-associated ferredoxin